VENPVIGNRPEPMTGFSTVVPILNDRIKRGGHAFQMWHVPHPRLKDNIYAGFT